MSIQTTALKYGWYIVAGAVLTGATIFVTDSTQKRITQRDAIQVILGTVERCYATQTATNPTYSVSPPSFVRSWVSTNGAGGWETNQVTNSISWYTDRAMMVSLDATIKALCPYYVDTNSVYDGTTNIIMHTFTGLLTSLDLGDHTNFTAIPAIGTNIATYGPWAWRNYVVAWQERYKVLEAMKATADTLVVKTNGLAGGYSSVYAVRDYARMVYSNLTTHELISVYNPNGVAYALGREPNYGYQENTNFNKIGPTFYDTKLTFSDCQTFNSWGWGWHRLNYPPWKTNFYGITTNLTAAGVNPGTLSVAIEWPYSYNYPYKSSEADEVQWAWTWISTVGYSAWEWYQGNTNLEKETSIYLWATVNNPQLNPYGFPELFATQSVDNAYDWQYPRSWDIDATGAFEEMAGMTTNCWNKLDMGFVTDDGIGKLRCAFGSDDQPPLFSDASVPAWCAEPGRGQDPTNNVGSVGKTLGMSFTDSYIVRDWDFQYATNKYW